MTILSPATPCTLEFENDHAGIRACSRRSAHGASQNRISSCELLVLHEKLIPPIPKKRANATPASPDLFFAKELAGEEPPSFGAMKTLYERASDLFGFRPWQILSESELVVARDSKSGELWYRSVMGSMREVYSMQAYRGEEGLRLFRSIAAEDLTDPGEVLASIYCLSVEFIPRKELKRQDRELLAAPSHPQGRDLVWRLLLEIRTGFFSNMPNDQKTGQKHGLSKQTIT